MTLVIVAVLLFVAAVCGWMSGPRDCEGPTSVGTVWKNR